MEKKCPVRFQKGIIKAAKSLSNPLWCTFLVIFFFLKMDPSFINYIILFEKKSFFLICFKTAKLVFFFNFRSIFLCCEFSRILYSMKPDREIFNYRHAFLWLWQGFSTKHYATTSVHWKHFVTSTFLLDTVLLEQ